MCDTLCLRSPGGALFAKNSDRPPSEVQLVELVGPRSGAGRLVTQYLEIADARAAAALVARPSWLWGAEHGVNEHGVAIGNERVYTALDPETVPPALIGMDLVRLGLERGRTAQEALEVMTALLETHGQGGVADQVHSEAYFSSFLISDAHQGWVLETSGRSWVARPTGAGEVISNRLSIRTDWTCSSGDLRAGEDWDLRRDQAAPTGHADIRLAAGRRLMTTAERGSLGARQVVAHLRDHGTGPWGAPGSSSAPQPPPGELQADFTGVSVCMHIRGYMATTSSMVVELPSDPEEPRRAWVAPGSPCVSLFVPCFPPQSQGRGVGAELGDEGTWRAGASLRDLVERAPEALVEIRTTLDPLEAELWEEAEELASSPNRWEAAASRWSVRASRALRSLASSLTES